MWKVSWNFGVLCSQSPVYDLDLLYNGLGTQKHNGVPLHTDSALRMAGLFVRVFVTSDYVHADLGYGYPCDAFIIPSIY